MGAHSGIQDLTAVRAAIGQPHPLVKAKILDRLDDQGRKFIAASPLMMLATANADGEPDVSPRGDQPRTVVVADERKLYLPERHGNKLAFSLQNILENSNVAVIFMIPGVDESYRVHGTARIVDDTETLTKLTALGKPALLAIEVKVTRCFLHCGKAFKRSRLWQADARQNHKFRFGATIARARGGDRK